MLFTDLFNDYIQSVIIIESRTLIPRLHWRKEMGRGSYSKLWRRIQIFECVPPQFQLPHHCLLGFTPLLLPSWDFKDTGCKDLDLLLSQQVLSIPLMWLLVFRIITGNSTRVTLHRSQEIGRLDRSQALQGGCLLLSGSSQETGFP